MKRIAALVPNVLGWAPGQRVRVESWAPHLERAGWSVDFYPFEDDRLHEVLYRPGGTARKASRMLACYGRQLGRVLGGIDCDVLLVHREAALLGPAVIERLARRRGVPLVYDIDDPLFVPYRSPVNGALSALKFASKTDALLRLSDHVIAINRLIGDYAARRNPAVTVVPNFVDTERYRPAAAGGADGRLRLGWIGSASTIGNLQMIAGPLRRLQEGSPALLRVIGTGAPQLPGVELEMREWSAASELTDLAECDIGLVPLPDLPWNRWKSFYKTIQYMALGLPVVAARMGSNAEVIEDSVNGFLVDSDEEWVARLRALADDPRLRRTVGAAARATVLERYSLRSQMPRLVSLFARIEREGGRS